MFYATNNIVVFHMDDNRSMDFLGMNDFGPKTFKVFRYILAVVDEFSKIGWTNTLKTQNDLTMND